MCGIVAQFSKVSAVSREALLRSCEGLHHRGPDCRKAWFDPRLKVGLGHARLSIIGLTQGNQPLSNEDGTLHAVVNGEFYGYEAIRRELEEVGHKFKTDSDSEVLVHLYEESGIECLHRLRGEFAFVLWDERRQELFAVRDRFGIKPLYWTRHGPNVLIASEIKGLAQLGFPLAWDEDAFWQSNFFALPESRSLFKGIQQVPAGHYLKVTDRQEVLEQYWDLSYAPGSAPGFTLEESVESVRSAITEAVALRLRADVPVACYLSGGLDSSAVFGLAARVSGRPPKAFTLAFNGPDFDESAVASESAAYWGAAIETVRIREEDLAQHYSSALWHAERFVYNTNGIGKYLLSEAVRKAGYRVVLTGEGADEIFGGYPHFVRDNMLQETRIGSDAAMAANLRELQRSNVVFQGLDQTVADDPIWNKVSRRLGFVPSMWTCNFPIAVRIQSLFNNTYCERFGAGCPFTQFLECLPARGLQGSWAPVQKSMYLWCKSWLPQYILQYLGDRMEMAHSVEGRLPFLDDAVVGAAQHIPPGWHFDAIGGKRMLRLALADYVTPTVLERRKHPFAAPPSPWREGGPLFELLLDTLHSAGARSLPFFDTKAVDLFLNEQKAMTGGSRMVADAVLNVVLSTALLHRLFGL